MNSPDKLARFALGQITYTLPVQAAATQNGQSLLRLLRRHLQGDRGEALLETVNWLNYPALGANGQTPPDDDIESCYRLADGQTLVSIITHYVHTPALRWTDICLVDELVSGRPVAADDDPGPDLSCEAAFILVSSAATDDEAELFCFSGGDDANA